jgi:hypothetical protein
MSQPEPPRPSPPESAEARAPADLCRQALQSLQAALDQPPTALKAEVDVAECAIAALRDALIDRWRAHPAAQVRAALDQTNVALSLVVGLEYPVGGLQRPLIEQAESTLQRTLSAILAL